MTLTLERPVGVPCEIAATMAFAHHQVFGHWRDDDNPHDYGCACPAPPASIAARIGDESGDRLVVLLTKFAYRVHTPDEETEMLALIQEAKP